MKGQNIGMMTVFVFVFIIAGNVYGAVFLEGEFEKRIEYNIGDVNQISEAQIRADHYIPRMEKEIYYSSNIVALESSEIPVEWGSGSVPSEDEVKSDYLARVENELKTQSRIIDCRPPDLGDVTVEKSHSYVVEFDYPYVTCSDTSSQAEIKLGAEQITVKHPQNTYLNISRVAVALGDHIESKNLPSGWSATARGSSECEEEQSTAISIARGNAQFKAREMAIKDERLSDTAMEGFRWEQEWIEIRNSTDYNIEYEEIGSPSSNPCDYVDQGCVESSESGQESDGEEGDSETEIPDRCRRTGFEASTLYTADVQTADLGYRLKDTERQVLNSQASYQNIVFSFDFIHRF